MHGEATFPIKNVFENFEKLSSIILGRVAREEVRVASETLGRGKTSKNTLVENYLVSLGVFLVLISFFFR